MILSLILLLSITASADSHCDFADETILLGGVVPLSAPGSVAGGIGMKWGFEQAVADINSRLRDCDRRRESSPRPGHWRFGRRL